MRFARRLIVTAAVLGGLFIGANVVAERVAEDRLADAAQKELHTSTRPMASLDFPVLIDLLKGKLGRIVLDGRDAKLDDLSVATVHIVLQGIDNPLDAISKNTPLHVSEGSISVTVETKAVNDLLARRRESARVELRENLVIVTGKVGSCPVRAEGLPRLEKGDLVFRPPKTPTTTCPVAPSRFTQQALIEATTFRVALPKLPGGIAIGRIEVHAGRLTLVAALKDAVIDLG
jgi:DUF2993 family protein